MYLDQMKDEGGRLFRWSLFLQDFDFTVKHPPSKMNNNADGLSRQAWETTELPSLLGGKGEVSESLTNGTLQQGIQPNVAKERDTEERKVITPKSVN